MEERDTTIPYAFPHKEGKHKIPYSVDEDPPNLSKCKFATTNILWGEATDIGISPKVPNNGLTLDVTTDAREYELETNCEPPEKATTGILYTVGHLVDGKVNVMWTLSDVTRKPPYTEGKHETNVFVFILFTTYV